MLLVILWRGRKYFSIDAKTLFTPDYETNITGVKTKISDPSRCLTKCTQTMLPNVATLINFSAAAFICLLE